MRNGPLPLCPEWVSASDSPSDAARAVGHLYQAGLYLTAESSDAMTVIAADVSMVIKIEITSIFVSQEKLVAALNDGFQKSTNGNLEPIRNEVRQFRQCFADSINKGDVFDIVYIPSSGLVVRKNGRQMWIIKLQELGCFLWCICRPIRLIITRKKDH